MGLHDIPSDQGVVQKCRDFVQKYQQRLVGLRKYLLVHFLNLFHWGLICSEDIIALMSLFDGCHGFKEQEDSTTPSLQNSHSDDTPQEDSDDDEIIFNT